MYTSCTRAMATLENVVHRSGEGLQSAFRLLVIHVPDALAIDKIQPKALPQDWHLRTHRSVTQQLGDDWVAANEHHF